MIPRMVRIEGVNTPAKVPSRPAACFAPAALTDASPRLLRPVVGWEAGGYTDAAAGYREARRTLSSFPPPSSRRLAAAPRVEGRESRHTATRPGHRPWSRAPPSPGPTIWGGGALTTTNQGRTEERR